LDRKGRWKVVISEVYRDTFIDLEFGIPTSIFRTNVEDYTSVRRYLRLLRGKVFMALGIEDTLKKWHKDRSVRKGQGSNGS